MTIRIELFASQHIPAIQALNGRLAAHQVHSGFLLPESMVAPVPDRAAPVFKDQYLVLDGEHVRGGFMVQSQKFWIVGQERTIGNCQMPISEGLIDKAYSAIGILMLRHALRVHPQLFALGMGSRQNPFPRMLAAMGWQLTDIPFLFRVCSPGSFLRNIVPLRGTPTRRVLLDTLAATGVGWAGLRLMQLRVPTPPRLAVEECGAFGDWADEIWDSAKAGLSFGAVRSSQMLNLLYPSGETHFLRLKITSGPSIAGWAVLLDTQMNKHRYFGDLRVGMIVDTLARPGQHAGVAAAASAYLEGRGVGIIVTNQGHSDWDATFRRCGFLGGPSNYILATSPKLTGALQPWPVHQTRLHVNRGDGEGPLNLF